MLVEEQFAAGAQHAPQLGERVRLVGHRAEDEACDGGIERRILSGQAVGDAVENLDPNVGSRGGGRRARSRRYGSGSTATTSSTVAG